MNRMNRNNQFQRETTSTKINLYDIIVHLLSSSQKRIQHNDRSSNVDTAQMESLLPCDDIENTILPSTHDTDTIVILDDTCDEMDHDLEMAKKLQATYDREDRTLQDIEKKRLGVLATKKISSTKQPVRTIHSFFHKK